jgi:hypothetical protein
MLGRICSWGAVFWIAMAPVAWSEETVSWGKVGGWDIRVDRTVGDGCFAMQVFERGTVVRIGFDVASKAIYLVFGHDNWKSLEEGKVYPVVIRFDSGQEYKGSMEGQRLAKTVFLVHHNLNNDFLKDFMQRNTMEVFYRGDSIANLSLRNTYAAVGEVINCQREIVAGSKPQDPFSGTPASRGGGSGSDPFK